MNVTFNKAEFLSFAATQNVSPFFMKLIEALADIAFANKLGAVIEDGVLFSYNKPGVASNKIAAIKWVRDFVNQNANPEMKAYFMSVLPNRKFELILYPEGYKLPAGGKFVYGHLGLADAKAYVEHILMKNGICV